jgi:protein-serine/threonine kinase
MDNSGNRLYLNFGNNNERLAPTDRTYPTTPSTFPQPVFQGAGSSSNQGGLNPASAQQQGQYSAGYANAQYQGQYFQGLAPQTAEYGAANAGGGYAPPRSTTPGTSNDPNTGLAHQFSHQNLGGAARGSPYGARGPSPAQRPRTAGAAGQQQNYSYLNAPMPNQPPQLEFASAPERNPDRYGPNANSNQKKCSQLASDFFKDSVKRARERNQRCVAAAGYLASHRLTPCRSGLAGRAGQHTS